MYSSPHIHITYGVKILGLVTWRWWLRNFKQDCGCVHISELKSGEVNAIDIGFWWAQVVWKKITQNQSQDFSLECVLKN